MRTLMKWSAAVAAAVVLVALALTACGDDDDSSGAAASTGGSASTPAASISKIGDRRAREGQRLRLEPAGRRERPARGAGRRRRHRGRRRHRLRQRRARAPPPRAERQQADHRPGERLQHHRPEGRDAVQASRRSSSTRPTPTSPARWPTSRPRASRAPTSPGILAAKTTKTGTLGIVISAADTNWYKMAGGFVAGARSVNPNVKFRLRPDRPGGLRRLGRRQARHRPGHRLGCRRGLRHGRRRVVRDAAGRRDGEAARRAPTKVYFIDVIGDKTNGRQEGRAALVGGLGLHGHLQPGHRRRRRRHLRHTQNYDLTVAERHLAAEDRQGAGRGVGRHRRGSEGHRRRQHRDPAHARQGGAGPADRLATDRQRRRPGRGSRRPGRRHDDGTDEPSLTTRTHGRRPRPGSRWSSRASPSPSRGSWRTTTSTW